MQQVAPWHERRDIRARERDRTDAAVERGHAGRCAGGWHVDRDHPLAAVAVVIADVEVAVRAAPPLITDLWSARRGVGDGDGAATTTTRPISCCCDPTLAVDGQVRRRVGTG